MTSTTALHDLDEFPMADGSYVWTAQGPRGKAWSIVWQPSRAADNMRAWPYPAGKTRHRATAGDVGTARREAVRMAALIAAGKAA